MKKYQKVLLITSGCLILGGGIIMTAGWASGGRIGFQITPAGIRTTEDYQGEFIEKSVDLKNVKKLNINVHEADIEILEGENFHLEYGYDNAAQSLKEEVKDGTYHLASKNVPRQIYWSGLSFGSMSYQSGDSYVRIYIPKGKQLEDVQITDGYGNVTVETADANTFIINAESGDVNVKNLKAQTASLNTDYGRFQMDSSTVTDLTVNNESGEGKVNDLTAEKVSMNFAYGNMSLKDITTDSLNLYSESGKISVENLAGSGKNKLAKSMVLGAEYGEIYLTNVETSYLEISSESGNIEGNLITAAEAKMDIDYGECDMKQFTSKKVDVDSESGDIVLVMTGKEDEYDISMITDYGSATLNGKDYGTNFIREKGARNKLELKAESGSIKISTEN